LKPIILLHGAIGSAVQLEPLRQKLTEDFDCHLMNFIGHGGLAIPGTFSIPLFADQLEEYIRTNKIEPVDIFGYSMGGYVAAYLAVNRPELVGRIITLGTKWKWDRDIAIRERRMLDAGKIQAKVPAFAETLARRHVPQDWKMILERTSRMMEDMGKRNPLTPVQMRSIPHHVLVCLADADTMVSLEETRETVDALPNGEFRLIGSSEHPIEKVNIEQLAAEIRNFLATFAA
jgi:pimeloyl-ACP methyl ester carboxylesterase